MRTTIMPYMYRAACFVSQFFRHRNNLLTSQRGIWSRSISRAWLPFLWNYDKMLFDLEMLQTREALNFVQLYQRNSNGVVSKPRITEHESKSLHVSELCKILRKWPRKYIFVVPFIHSWATRLFPKENRTVWWLCCLWKSRKEQIVVHVWRDLCFAHFPMDATPCQSSTK